MAKLTSSITLHIACALFICLWPVCSMVPELLNVTAIVFYCLCGVILGISYYIVTNENKRMGVVYSMGHGYVVALILLSIFFLQGLFANKSLENIEDSLEYIILFTVPVFGTACYFAGQAARILAKYSEKKEG